MPNAADISRIEVLAYPRSPNKCAAFSINSALLSPIEPSEVSLIFGLATLTLWAVFFAFELGVVMDFILMRAGFVRMLNAKFSVP